MIKVRNNLKHTIAFLDQKLFLGLYWKQVHFYNEFKFVFLKMENFLQLLSSSSDHCTVSRENRSPTRLANKVKKCQKFKFEQKTQTLFLSGFLLFF
jgi:hypothetical protein